MTSSFVRIPYTCTMCIWMRTRDCIMLHHRHEAGLHMKPLTARKPLFTGEDSVLIFDAPNAKVMKYGNAIHRDKDVVYL